MNLRIYLLWAALFVMLAACSDNKKEATEAMLDEAQVGQQILDFYHKYSRGYYVAMQNNLADTVKLFKTATYVNAHMVTEKMKAENTGVIYMPDLSSLKIKRRLATIKVMKHQQQKKQLVFVSIQFNKQGKIVSYKEEQLSKTTHQAKATKPHYNKYNGKYALNEHKTLNIVWAQGSELAYEVMLTSPGCVGKFNGKAFFTDQHTAISNQGGKCKITFDFSTAGKVKVSETTNCRTSHTKNCKFDGEYNLTN
ncbi:hypothetical protein [uncultured Microscilla sp.]|uniref:hypothetical protein n=1 Tax=uncultured Microscilla sp. TaxID=432653 RepID=UPI0026283A72|nr:hypothetical protein [uncultured Microscilla sp.]